MRVRPATGMLATLVDDLRSAAGNLRRHMRFTLTVVATLALGIGPTTAIFSVVRAVVLRPLPFPEPGRLVQIYETSPLTPDGSAVGPALKAALATDAPSVEAVSGFAVSARYLRGGAAGARRLMTVSVDRSFFAVLGVAPLRGRTFAPDDSAAVAVIGEGFWTGQLGADPAVLGQSIDLDGTMVTVIGVMPRSFQFPYRAGALLAGIATEQPTDLWMPIGQPGEASVGRSSLIGRLKPGVTLARAREEAGSLAARFALQGPPATRDRGVLLRPLDEVVISPTARRSLAILFGAVAMVLILACANVANLSLIRVTIRSREIAVRTALGASPNRVARQLLIESVLLALAGGALGLALAWWGGDRLAALAAPLLPRLCEASIDWSVFLFLLAACSATGILSGLAPALIARRADAQSVLQSAGRNTMSTARRRMRDALVVIEVALAFALAIGATLLVRELVRLRQTATGLTPANVVTAHLGQRMTAQTNVLAYYDIADRMTQVPGVTAAGMIQMLPLQNWGWTSNSTDFRFRGRPDAPGIFPIELRYVTPGYFEAMGITMRAGRGFTAGDVKDAPPVIVINETLARRYFADAASAIGAAMTRGTIVGVTADVRQVHLDRPTAPEIYYPAAQNWSQTSDLGMTLAVRTSRPLAEAAEEIRAAVRGVNPVLAVFDVKTMENVVADSLADYMLYLWLMAGFAVFALVLAAAGTYGVLAYAVASRRREFAVRVALGAGGARVTRLVLGHGLRMAAAGMAAGALVAWAAAPLLARLPIGIRRPDAVTIAPVALAVVLIAAGACLVPALRAARTDPTEALRQE